MRLRREKKSALKTVTVWPRLRVCIDNDGREKKLKKRKLKLRARTAALAQTVFFVVQHYFSFDQLEIIEHWHSLNLLWLA